MKHPNPKSEIRNPICLWVMFFEASVLNAATNPGQLEEDLVLSPPHPELPPTFWEQYGAWPVLVAVVLVALASFIAWRWLRPKPPVALPIEIQARQELEALRQRTEDGQTLSRVSRVLRRYVAAAFALPPDEFTTSEFCRALAGNEKIGADLATPVGEFLHRCDEHKFAPHDLPTPMGAAARALELVELGEARRAQLQQLATTVAADQPACRA